MTLRRPPSSQGGGRTSTSHQPTGSPGRLTELRWGTGPPGGTCAPGLPAESTGRDAVRAAAHALGSGRHRTKAGGVLYSTGRSGLGGSFWAGAELQTPKGRLGGGRPHVGPAAFRCPLPVSRLLPNNVMKHPVPECPWVPPPVHVTGKSCASTAAGVSASLPLCPLGLPVTAQPGHGLRPKVPAAAALPGPPCGPSRRPQGCFPRTEPCFSGLFPLLPARMRRMAALRLHYLGDTGDSRAHAGTLCTWRPNSDGAGGLRGPGASS